MKYRMKSEVQRGDEEKNLNMAISQAIQTSKRSWREEWVTH